MAKPNLAPAVVPRLIAEHIEEQAVDSILIETFGKYLHRLLAVVPAVDAGGVQTVVDHRLSISLAKKPLRMRVEDGFGRLAEIVPSDDPNLAGMSFPDHVTEHVAPGRQLRTRIVELGLGRIIGGNASHPYEQDVGAHVRELIHQSRRIEARVGLPQICLDPADRLLHPPALLRSGGGYQ